jgi:release factor glutamine methyltransferase
MQVKDFILNTKNLSHLELEVLLLFVLNISKTDLLKNPDLTLTAEQISQIDQLVQHRLQGVPIAYLTGSKEFYGLEFSVTPDVLIPRPETEEMVEIALGLKPAPHKILDIGTGSGAIACTLAHKLPQPHITAVDISDNALLVAKKNAAKFNLSNIEFIKSDFLNKITPGTEFDLIITNPPYIKLSDTALMSHETLKFEPKLALFSGEDGLDAYRQIFKQIDQKRIKFKHFLGEFGATQEKELIDLLDIYFYGKYQVRKDLAGIPRFIII